MKRKVERRVNYKGRFHDGMDDGFYWWLRGKVVMCGFRSTPRRSLRFKTANKFRAAVDSGELKPVKKGRK